MYDSSVVGPVVTLLALLDIVLHIRLDYRSLRNRSQSQSIEPGGSVPSYAIVLVAVSTLLSFALVLLIIVGWLTMSDPLHSTLFFPLFDVSSIVWVTGLLSLSVGIVLHGWSRQARREMATSWAMSQEHVLVKSGPYRWVRHPSYTSYFLCFVGIILLSPSIVTLVLLLGFPGYYGVAVEEEEQLIAHFGDEYREYMEHTGRFLPRIR